MDYAIVQALNLRGDTKTVFMSFIRKEYPKIYDRLMDMYKTGYAPKEYRMKLAEETSKLMKKYGINENYMEVFRQRYTKQKKDDFVQLSLFD